MALLKPQSSPSATMSRGLYFYRWVMWNVFSRLFVTAYLRPTYRFCRAPDSDRFPKPPFVLIANHGTFFDPWIIGAYSPYPFALMCNDDAFRGSPLTRWYLTSIGAFPKKKGASDFRAMKTTLGLLAAGYPVCIFPEGQTTWDGETQLMYKGIERIIKRSACALVTVRLQGNFLTKPWWAESTRKGRIVLTIRVLPPDRVKEMPPDALFEYMRESIRQNDIADPTNLAAPFVGKRLAHGVERLLWLCPHCRAEDRLSAQGDTIRCDGCRGSWVMDPWCRIRPHQGATAAPSDLHAWARWQRRQVIDKVQTVGDADVLTENAGVMLQTPNETGAFIDQGMGALRLTQSELSFSPLDTSKTALTIPLSEISNYVIQRKDIFECSWQGTDYRFRFQRKSPMKWVDYLRYLKGYELFEAQGWIE